MKTLLMCGMAVVLAGATIGHADAASSKKKKRLYSSQPTNSYPAGMPGRRNGGSGGDYFENVIESQRFGSQQWWEVFGRQRGGPQG